MANTDKWYYAYTIEGDTITVIDACHVQNMHEWHTFPFYPIISAEILN